MPTILTPTFSESQFNPVKQKDWTFAFDGSITLQFSSDNLTGSIDDFIKRVFDTLINVTLDFSGANLNDAKPCLTEVLDCDFLRLPGETIRCLTINIYLEMLDRR